MKTKMVTKFNFAIEVYSGLCLFLSIVYSMFQRCPDRRDFISSRPIKLKKKDSKFQNFTKFQKFHIKFQNFQNDKINFFF